jgi:hypothetical protein
MIIYVCVCSLCSDAIWVLFIAFWFQLAPSSAFCRSPCHCEFCIVRFCPRTVSPQQSIRAVGETYGIVMGFNEMISTRFWYMGWYGSVWEWVVDHHFMAILVEKIMFLGGLVKLGVPPKPMIIGFPSKRIRLFWWLPSSKLTVRPWQIGVGRLVSIKNWWFSGSMLIYQGVIPWVTLCFGKEKKTSPAAAGLWPIRQDWYRKGWVGGCQHGGVTMLPALLAIMNNKHAPTNEKTCLYSIGCLRNHRWNGLSGCLGQRWQSFCVFCVGNLSNVEFIWIHTCVFSYHLISMFCIRSCFAKSLCALDFSAGWWC